MLNHKPRKGSWICFSGDHPYEIIETRDDGIATMRRTSNHYGKEVSSAFIYYFSRTNEWNALAFHCTKDGEPLSFDKSVVKMKS